MADRFRAIRTGGTNQCSIIYMEQNIPYLLRDTVAYKPFDWQSIMNIEHKVTQTSQLSGCVDTILWL